MAGLACNTVWNVFQAVSALPVGSGLYQEPATGHQSSCNACDKNSLRQREPWEPELAWAVPLACIPSLGNKVSISQSRYTSVDSNCLGWVASLLNRSLTVRFSRGPHHWLPVTSPLTIDPTKRSLGYYLTLVGAGSQRARSSHYRAWVVLVQQKIHLIFCIHGPSSWIQPTEDCKYFLKIVSIEDFFSCHYFVNDLVQQWFREYLCWVRHHKSPRDGLESLGYMLTYNFIWTTQASYISERGMGGAGLATHISQLRKDGCPQLLQLGWVGRGEGTSELSEERDTGVFQRSFKSLDCGTSKLCGDCHHRCVVWSMGTSRSHSVLELNAYFRLGTQGSRAACRL